VSVIPFPYSPAPRGVTHAGILATILDELPDDIPADVAVWLSLSRCLTTVKGRTVTITWPEYPTRVLRVPLALVRRNSRRMEAAG
jgi:hypothetical protein